MKTNFINRNSVKAAFNADNNSFNRAFRFLHELSKTTPAKIPAAPATDDTTKEATLLRAEIRRNTAINNNIADAQKIMKAFNVTGACNDKTLKEAKKVCDQFLPYVCAKTVKKADGSENTIYFGVKFSKLPGYMKDVKGVDFKKVFIVVESSWIERIFDAAEVITNLMESGAAWSKDADKNPILVTLTADKEKGVLEAPVFFKPTVFELTEAPHKEDTTPAGASSKVYTWKEAAGSLANENGEAIDTDEVFKIWYKEAIRNSDANGAAREAKQEYLKNNK